MHSPTVAVDISKSQASSVPLLSNFQLSSATSALKSQILRDTEMASVAVDALLGHLESPEMASFMKNDNLSTILENLRYLRAFLEDPPREFVTNGKLANLESMDNAAASIISLFDVKKMDEDMTREMNRMLFSLETKIEQIKKEAKVIYDQIQQLPRSYFPKIEQLGFIDYVVENLRELLKHKAASVALLKHQIATVTDLLPSLRAHWVTDIEDPDEEEELFPEEIEEVRKKNQELKDLRIRIMQVVYEVEYVTDSSLSGDRPTWHHKFWLDDILEEIRLTIKDSSVEIYDKERIVERLISDTQGLDVVSILNVPAASKTDPAEEIYDNYWVSEKFHIRVRCVISQSYEKREREVLLGLIHSLLEKKVYEMSGEEDEMNPTDLAEKLYKSLSGRRCLMVVEDIWDIQTEEKLKRILRNCCGGSRIVLTTRFAEVAFRFPYTYVVKMDTTNRFQLLIPGDQQVAEASSHDLSQTIKSMMEEDVIGFEKETKIAFVRLFSGPLDLDFVSVVGMPGIGKTAFSSKLYMDSSVVNHFNCRAWCSISETYDRRNTLMQILRCLIPLVSDMAHKADEELAEMLYERLKGWRYFIILDDVWNTEAYDDLTTYFPNDKNGSRILLTTRLTEVADEVKPPSEPLFLSLLSDDECWQLLNSKVFGSGSCPAELLTVGKKIARKCKGLPLLVVLTAGRLVAMEKKEDAWKRVEKNTSLILDDADRTHMSVIESSYRYLPDHVKPCFLYIGGFPEDKVIPVQKLILLWIAEGFVRHSDFKSSEEIAEDYLMDLIRRNLVMAAEVNWKGRVKGCRVHDLIRDFCLVKAKDANFWQHINGYDVHFPVSDDYLDPSVDPNYPRTSKLKIHDRRWLSIYSKRKDFIMSKPSGPRVRSLLFFASNVDDGSDPSDFLFMPENFQLLRVVDFENINIVKSFEPFCMLVHLRYLAVRCYAPSDSYSIPSSIANLWSLETFIVKGFLQKLIVPDSIWDMARLRHLHICRRAYFSLCNHRFENSSLLENLQTLSEVPLNSGNGLEEILRRLPSLRKLRCIIWDQWDYAGRIAKLDFPTQIESLDVWYTCRLTYLGQFHFPSNLRKLTLSCSAMPWYYLPELARQVPNLEVLKLRYRAFEGKSWEVVDGCFQHLRMLKLEAMDFEDWSANKDSFPCLERLVVHHCEQLKEIPPSLGDIPTLKIIEVKWCNRSIVDSARVIHQKQLKLGNEDFRVDIC